MFALDYLLEFVGTFLCKCAVTEFDSGIIVFDFTISRYINAKFPFVQISRLSVSSVRILRNVYVMVV